jgi:alkylation response protein AidB-like acyl-CoA dehydrogenase
MIRFTQITEDQEYKILRDTASAYALNELSAQAEQLDLDPTAGMVKEALSKAGEIGMLAALIPDRFGGG